MQLYYQFGLFVFSLFEGPGEQFVFTTISILLTLIGFINYRSIRAAQRYAANGNEKYELSKSQVRQLRWLKVTGLMLITGVPSLIIVLPYYLGFNRPSTSSWLWVESCFLNAPGIIYCIQAISVRFSSANKWQWPRYL